MSDPTHAPAGLPAISPRILVVDDEESVIMTLSRVLEREGWSVLQATSPEAADSILTTMVPDVAIVDVYLSHEDGLSYVSQLRKRFSDMGIVVISGEDTTSLASKAVDTGADLFLSKPIVPGALVLTVRKLAELRRERQRAIDLERELRNSVKSSVFPEIVTNCDAMLAVLNLVQKVAHRDLSVLICGESGTGKELVARAVHSLSPRNRGSFVELNCAALPASLVESELFGHERGAFTGAVSSRVGKIQLASGGTLFLDEIGELPLEIQPKLLRALQEKKIVPVGGKEPVNCDFRLISATNRDLVEEVNAGRFREDLFYRVAVFPIKLPDLRSRMEDLDLLLGHFLSQEGVREPRISPEARVLLHQHSWPGNVRELKNFAQAITLFTEGGMIDETSVRAYFGSRLQGFGGSEPEGSAAAGPGLRRPVRKLEDLERAEILYALNIFDGNVSEAARALGMGRATLYKYIKRHNLNLDQFIPRQAPAAAGEQPAGA